MQTYCPATAWLYSTRSACVGSGLVIVEREFERCMLQLDHDEGTVRGKRGEEEHLNDAEVGAWSNHVVVHLAAAGLSSGRSVSRVVQYVRAGAHRLTVLARG